MNLFHIFLQPLISEFIFSLRKKILKFLEKNCYYLPIPISASCKATFSDFDAKVISGQ